MSDEENPTVLHETIKVEPIFNHADVDACNTSSIPIKQEIGDDSIPADITKNEINLIVVKKDERCHEGDADIDSTNVGHLFENDDKSLIHIKQEICDDSVSVDVFSKSDSEPLVIEKCEFCHEEFYSTKLKEDHIDVHLIKNITCPLCNETFETKRDYLGHYTIHRSQISIPTDNFECSTCLKSFVTKQKLKLHVKRHQLTALQCHECFKCFSRKDDLITHTRVHSGERPFTCTECLKSFTQRGHLKSHKLTHLGQKEQCPVCLKLFSKDSLRKHEKRHKEKPKFSCDSCSRSFYVLSHLKRHVISHSGEKMYECELCFKKFSESHDLKRHLRIHSGVKPFQCDSCFKKFTEKSQLKTHMKNHSSDRPHTCPVCFKGFRKKYDVTHHLQNQHIQEKIFKCLVCQQRFRKEFFLRMHVKSKHGDIKDEFVAKK